MPGDYDGDAKTDIAVFHPASAAWDALQTSGVQGLNYYTYDPAGNIAMIQDSTTAENQSFTYDALDRLASASATAGPAPYTQTYGYNAIGNMTTKNAATYAYGNTAHKHAVTSLTTGESYTYDANGNMTQRVEGGLTYTQAFDAENRLSTVTVSGQTTQFIYDGDGNLVKKIKPDGSRTIYIGGIYEVDKNSAGTVTGTKTYYPVAGGAMRINSTLYYNLTDQLGSASVMTDASGNVVGENRYFPYGETRVSTGIMYTDKLFTGQRDTGLGIYDFNARYYSPKLGRFLSPDTIVQDFGNPQNLNRFSYVVNNPIRYTDPTGHCFTGFVADTVICYDVLLVAAAAITAVYYAIVPPPALMSDKKLRLLRPDPPIIIPKIINKPKYPKCDSLCKLLALGSLSFVACVEIFGDDCVHAVRGPNPNTPVPTPTLTLTPTLIVTSTSTSTLTVTPTLTVTSTSTATQPAMSTPLPASPIFTPAPPHPGGPAIPI